jgi:hypothetical protein
MFNIFSSFSAPISPKENNNLYPSWSWSTVIKDADGKDVPVSELINKYNRLNESAEHLRGEAEKFYEENKKLKDQLNSIEEDGTYEHNNAIKLREENAVLKNRNTELLEKYNGFVTMGGLKYMEAKLQIVQNDYKKCAEQRDEYKHQLNAANKEIVVLKKDIVVLKKDIVVLKKDIVDYVFDKDEEIEKMKTEKYYVCNHCGYKVAHDTNYYGGCGFCKDGIMIEKEETIDNPMYPIHWGTLDPDIYEKAKNMSIEEAIKDVAKAEVENEDSFECPCNRCKEPEENLVDRVSKLEKKIEELTIIKKSKKAIRL